MFSVQKKQGFSCEVDQWVILNNSLFFKNNELLFSLLFSETFYGGQGPEGGRRERTKFGLGDPPVPSTLTRENFE